MEVEGAAGDCLEEFCLCCDTAGSGKILICNGNGCPIAIHEECLNYEPDFDDMGKFYCPYCWLKRELERTRGLKRKPLVANEKLTKLRCLRKDRDGENEKMLENVAENTKATSESSMPGKMNAGDCKSDDCKEVAQGVESSTQGRSDEKDISKAEKHRRLWTAEEEEMLTEGLQKFSAKINKNIPWRKILEFGRHVFHPTRTPADLKDKWKNMKAKETSKGNGKN